MRSCLLGLGSAYLVACGAKYGGADTDTGTETDGGGGTDTAPTVIQGQIVVEPGEVDFGALPPGCRQEQELLVRNDGNYPLEILSLAWVDGGGPFDFAGEPTVLGAGDQLRVQVSFEPSGVGPSSAQLRIESDDVDTWKVDVPVSGEGAPDERVEEVFQQAEARAVDLLLVLDDGSGLSARLEQLANAAPALLADLDALGVDYRVAVIDGDASTPDRVGVFHESPVTPGQPDGATVLGQAIRAATGGTSDRAFFDTATTALSPDLLSGPNRGFRRDEADLHVVIYSFDDDRSAQSASAFVSGLAGLLQGDATAKVSAISGPTGGLLPCFSLFGGDSADPAPRLGTAVRESGGEHWEICTFSSAEVARDLPPVLGGLQVEFALSREVGNVDWMIVQVDGAEVPQGGATGWSYVGSRNAVRFGADAVPAPGAEVSVAYPSPVPCP